MHSVTHPFTHSFIQLLFSFILSFINSFIHFVHSFARPFVRSFFCSFSHSFIRILMFCLNCSSSASIIKDEDCDLYAAPRGGVHPVSAASAVQLAPKFVCEILATILNFVFVKIISGGHNQSFYFYSVDFLGKSKGLIGIFNTSDLLHIHSVSEISAPLN
jgi:hypothetical protein